MKFILCAALAVMSGVAGAAVNKCVDQEGHVLLTDADCPQGLRTEAERPGEAAPQAALSAPGELAPAHVAPPVLPPVLTPAPRSRWADLPRPLIRKSASVDASTLQAAHQNMQMQDEMHKQRRLLSSR